MSSFAYIILAHKGPKQVAILIKSLNHEDDHFFVHIDKKFSIEPFYEEIKKLRIPNIHFVNKRENGQWGDIGLVLATLNAINDIVALDIDFCHVHLLSGQDFPIKPVAEIRRFFEKNSEYDFITYQQFPVEHMDGGGWHRLKNYSWTIRGKRLTYLPVSIKNSFSLKGRAVNFVLGSIEFFLPKRKLPNGFEPYCGSQWWSLKGETIRQIQDFVISNPGYCKFHKYSLIPDEMFFQILLLNLEDFKLPVNDNKRYILWEEGSSHPTILTAEYFNEFLKTDALFARKFNSLSDIRLVIKNLL